MSVKTSASDISNLKHLPMSVGSAKEAYQLLMHLPECLLLLALFHTKSGLWLTLTLFVQETGTRPKSHKLRFYRCYNMISEEGKGVLKLFHWGPLVLATGHR